MCLCFGEYAHNANVNVQFYPSTCWSYFPSLSILNPSPQSPLSTSLLSLYSLITPLLSSPSLPLNFQSWTTIPHCQSVTLIKNDYGCAFHKVLVLVVGDLLVIVFSCVIAFFLVFHTLFITMKVYLLVTFLTFCTPNWVSVQLIMPFWDNQFSFLLFVSL